MEKAKSPRQLVDQQVAEFAAIAGIGVGILGGTVRRQFSGIAVEHARPADEIQGDVGQRQIFFQEGSITAPLGQAMPQHQRVIPQADGILLDGFFRFRI